MDMDTALEQAAFDIEAYTRAPHGPMRAQLQGFGEELPAELAVALAYLQRRLQDTGTWLARVLVTATHKNARMTAFLTTWAYERHWLGDTLAALAGSVEASPSRRGLLRKLDSRLGALFAAVNANLHGDTLTGVQLTELLVDSWVLDAWLARCQALAPAGVVADLARVRATLARQRVFFQEVAMVHLKTSTHARRLTRRRLARRSWPIGAGNEPRGHTRHVYSYLFAAEPDWASRLDLRVAELPGLRGLRLATRGL